MTDLEIQCFEYLQVQKSRNYAPASLQTRMGCLRFFLDFCRQRKVSKITDLTVPLMRDYVCYIHDYRQSSGKELSVPRKRNLLISMNLFCDFLLDNNLLLVNPMLSIKLLKKEKTLPKNILSKREIVRILNTPDTTRYAGLRDRCALELLYATGLRSQEVVQLKVYDIDFAKKTVFVRQGKMRKDRVVPIGNRALKWLNHYLRYSRKNLQSFVETDSLFLDLYGKPMRRHNLANLVKKASEKVRQLKPVGTHSFRHAMATHMLRNGAPVRYVQAMLGHEQVTTTEIYTHVSLKDLLEKYRSIESKLYRKER